jgi:hypothetical protein
VEVTLLDVYPDSEPVTRTDTDAPASAADRVYAAEEAPLTAAPSRSHWYENTTPTGDHVPGAAVNTDPTCAVPPTVAVPAVSVPGSTDTGAEVTLVDV